MTTAFLFGVTVAIAVGPIALLIVGLSMSRGVSAGLRGGLGAGLADLSYAVVAFYGGAAVADLVGGQSDAIGVASSVILVALGLFMLRAAVRTFGEPRLPAAIEGSPLVATYLLTLSNPLTVVIFAGFAGTIAAGSLGADPLALALSLFAGSLLVQASLALGAGALGSALRDPRYISVLNVVSAVGIMAFGVIGFLRG
ncbi:MAG: LysE family transporter [Gemmatimonadota bacterium]